MIGLLRLSAIGLTALFLQAPLAYAEELISTIAPDVISVSSNYSGSAIVAFGVIQRPASAAPRAYDVIVTVTGPRQTVVARRKERTAGVWINRDSRTFTGVPSFLGVFSNRPLESIASANTLDAQRLGLKRILFAGRNVDANDPYLTNLIDIRVEKQLYREQPTGVTFLSPTAFRVDIPLPQSVLVGDYNVEFGVYSNGTLLTQKADKFSVAKVGVEEFVIGASTNYSLAYGLTTTAMALFMGWLASVIFRKD